MLDTAYGAFVPMPYPVRPGPLNDHGTEVLIEAGEADLLPAGADTNGVVDIFAVDSESRLDNDADGLDDRWEAAVGLSTASGLGVDGPNGDPDRDGLTNLAEWHGQSHPRGTETRHLAEGAQNAFFSTRVGLTNASPSRATAVVRVMGDNGQTRAAFVSMLGPGHRVLELRDLPDLPSGSFSLVVESDIPLAVERTMRWDASGYGTHAERAGTAPATRWFLAEGSTTGTFSLFYLLQNPGLVPANVTIRYLRPAPLPPIERVYLLPPVSRTTVPVNTEAPELASTDVSAAIDADQPIVVERAMYLSRPGQPLPPGMWRLASLRHSLGGISQRAQPARFSTASCSWPTRARSTRPSKRAISCRAARSSPSPTPLALTAA